MNGNFDRHSRSFIIDAIKYAESATSATAEASEASGDLVIRSNFFDFQSIRAH